MMNSVYKHHGSWSLLVSKSELVHRRRLTRCVYMKYSEFFLKLFMVLDAEHLLDFVQQLKASQPTFFQPCACET